MSAKDDAVIQHFSAGIREALEGVGLDADVVVRVVEEVSDGILPLYAEIERMNARGDIGIALPPELADITARQQAAVAELIRATAQGLTRQLLDTAASVLGQQICARVLAEEQVRAAARPPAH